MLQEEVIVQKLLDLLDIEEGNPKETILAFVLELKEIDTAKTYRSYSCRTFHFDYVFYLVAIDEYLQKKDYKNVLEQLRYIVVEEGDYITQPRFFVNLIHILEKIERD